jgi:hypothetical protein
MKIKVGKTFKIFNGKLAATPVQITLALGFSLTVPRILPGVRLAVTNPPQKDVPAHSTRCEKEDCDPHLPSSTT